MRYFTRTRATSLVFCNKLYFNWDLNIINIHSKCYFRYFIDRISSLFALFIGINFYQILIRTNTQFTKILLHDINIFFSSLDIYRSVFTPSTYWSKLLQPTSNKMRKITSCRFRICRYHHHTDNIHNSVATLKFIRKRSYSFNTPVSSNHIAIFGISSEFPHVSRIFARILIFTNSVIDSTVIRTKYLACNFIHADL